MTHDPHGQHETLPPELIEALRALDGPPIEPSAQHDDALLAGARKHLAAMAGESANRPDGLPLDNRPNRHVLAYIGAGGAVAAAAAITFAVWFSTGDGKEPIVAMSQAPAAPPAADVMPNSAPEDDLGAAARQPPPTALAGDIDNSGTLDILDAFALARAIEDEGPAARDRASDFNHDGKVDQQDADWLAEQAVALARGGGRG